MKTYTLNLHETKAYLLRALAQLEQCELRCQLLAGKYVEEDLNEHFVSSVKTSETKPLVRDILTDTRYIERCISNSDTAFKHAVENWVYVTGVNLTELAKVTHNKVDGKVTEAVYDNSSAKWDEFCENVINGLLETCDHVNCGQSTDMLPKGDKLTLYKNVFVYNAAANAQLRADVYIKRKDGSVVNICTEQSRERAIRTLKKISKSALDAGLYRTYFEHEQHGKLLCE